MTADLSAHRVLVNDARRPGSASGNHSSRLPGSPFLILLVKRLVKAEVSARAREGLIKLRVP